MYFVGLKYIHICNYVFLGSQESSSILRKHKSVISFNKSSIEYFSNIEEFSLLFCMAKAHGVWGVQPSYKQRTADLFRAVGPPSLILK